MNLASNIGLVTSGLSLIAFIVTAALYAYRAKLQSKKHTIESVPAQDRAALINDIAEYYRIPVDGMSGAAKERIVFAQLKQKGRRDFLFFLISLVIALLLALLAIIAIAGGNVKVATKQFSAIGNHAKVDCQKDGASNVSYTADYGYHIQNAFADTDNPQNVRNTKAWITSNNGKTASATSTFTGLKKVLGLNCPSSGSAQVKIYGTIAEDKGWLAMLYELLISGFAK